MFDAIVFDEAGNLSLNAEEHRMLIAAYETLQGHASQLMPTQPMPPTVLALRNDTTILMRTYVPAITNQSEMETFIPTVELMACETGSPYIFTVVPGFIGKTRVDPYLSTLAGNEVVHLTIVGPERAVCVPLMVVRSPAAAPELKLSAYYPADELRVIQLHEPIIPLGYCRNARQRHLAPSPPRIPVEVEGPLGPITRH